MKRGSSCMEIISNGSVSAVTAQPILQLTDRLQSHPLHAATAVELQRPDV